MAEWLEKIKNALDTSNALAYAHSASSSVGANKKDNMPSPSFSVKDADNLTTTCAPSLPPFVQGKVMDLVSGEDNPSHLVSGEDNPTIRHTSPRRRSTTTSISIETSKKIVAKKYLVKCT